MSDIEQAMGAPSSIRAIHWDAVEGLAVDRVAKDHAVFAIWPEPVDHDACFMQAGFTCFEDEGVDDQGFRRMIEQTFHWLAGFAQPTIVSADKPLHVVSWAERLLIACHLRPAAPQPTLVDYVEAAAPKPSLLPRMGIQVLWIGLAAPLATKLPELRGQLAQDHPVQQTRLAARGGTP